MKRLFYLIIPVLLLFGCNNRENLLLPPDLSPAEYQSGNVIQYWADYLVKSSNDDSYLLIPKESIADSLLNYGDEIIFRKVQNLAVRDSLVLQEGAVSRSNTYQFSIRRSGSIVDFFTSPPLATLFTEVNSSAQNLYLLSFADYLQANPVSPVFYSGQRAAIPLFSTGEAGVFSFGENAAPQLHLSGSEAFYALLISSSGQQLSVNFPASYTLAAGVINLSLHPSLSQSMQANLQNFFPNAAITTPIVKLQTTYSTGSNIAYLRLKTNSKGFFGKQWIRLTDNTAYSWQEGNPDTQSANWWQDSSGLSSFVSGSGNYFLLEPLEAQSEFTIPLDGSYNQVFLQELWFDLSNLALENTSVKVKPNPSVAALKQAYFNGNPFTLTGQSNVFEISFYNGSVPIRNLPGEAWLEFGFRTTLPSTANDRLFCVYRDAAEDKLSYKTASQGYDESHYTRSESYVYTGIANSGFYLFGAIQEGANQTIPYYKSTLTLQNSYGAVGWSEAKKRSYSHLQIDYSDHSVPNHPWMQGMPFTLANKQGIASLGAFSGEAEQNSVPGGFYISMPLSSQPDNILLFNNILYPRLSQYTPGSATGLNSFVWNSGTLTISPEFPGKLLGCSIGYTNPFPLMVYPTMTFAWGEIRFYTYGTAPSGSSAIFDVEKSSQLTDPYNLLTRQYYLSQTSAAYTVTSANEEDFMLYQPVLFFQRNARGNELLFYERILPQYRLYPYSQSVEYNPWAFVVDGDFNGIGLAYNGSYASYTDNIPHSFVTSAVDMGGADTILSLYQAQLVLPAFFVPGSLPEGSSARLEKLSSLPSTQNLLSAYQLLFKNAAGQVFYPNFYTVADADTEPYIYVPVGDIEAIPTARFFYRNLMGATVELQRVKEFSANYANEYKVIGNSFICSVPNPGWFYITGQ